jgi:hypothetical protein
MNDKEGDNRLISATSLAKEVNTSSCDMFDKLEKHGLISRNGNGWDLTTFGISKGGVYKQGTKINRYIAWPVSITHELEKIKEIENYGLITATSIGKHFDMSANRINSILSELGWIKKHEKTGWHVTETGKRLGGVQAKHTTSGVPFVRWTETIKNNEILVANIRQAGGDVTQVNEEEFHNINASNSLEFRDKFPPHYRAKDGHLVKSKAELIIDNGLYDYKIVHAYERKLTVEEGLYCDFYIPTNNVYIEYWGLEEEKYLSRKKRKLEIYSKYDLKLIQLYDKDVTNLDDILPAKLLDFDIVIG